MQKKAQIVMGLAIIRINGNGPPESLYGFVDFALSGQLFTLYTVAGGLAASAPSPGFFRLPAAFSSVHPIVIQFALRIPRDHSG